MANVSEFQQPEPQTQRVFISFRGEEVRHKLLAFLKAELTKNNIKFLTDEEEVRGYPITIIFDRIRESDIALVIITDKFPGSRWCLNELVEMKKQVEAKKLVIIPIFYGVDAGTVKTQKGWFNNLLLKTENDARMKVDRRSKKAILDTEAMIWEWRQALVFAGRYMGIKYVAETKEDAFVLEIVDKLQKRLKIKPTKAELKENHVEQSIEEIGGLTKNLQDLNLEKSDLDDVIHLEPSPNNNIKGQFDDFVFLDLNSLQDPVLVQQLSEPGQAGKVVLVLLGSVERYNKESGLRPFVLPKNPSQVWLGDANTLIVSTQERPDQIININHMIASSSETGENTNIISRNRTDEENCLSFLSYMLNSFKVSSKSVFISFGEKKLGRTLVSCIKRELKTNHISCIDQTKESINESRVAIVLFSSNYPESEKCLDELFEIKKRMDEGGVDVLPVFYELNHENVEKLSGWFLNRLLKIEHEVRKTVDRRDKKSVLDTEDRIWGWRQALLSISTKPKVTYQHRNIVEFVDDIVKDVKDLLRKRRQKPIVAKPLMLPQETIFYTLNSLLHALNYQISDIECLTEMPHGFVSLKLKKHVSLVFFNLTCQDTLLLIQRIAALQYFKERMTRDA